MLMDDLIKILFSIIALLASYLLAHGLIKLKGFEYLINRSGRYGAIDGLRGYLALFVFIHHFVLTWYWKNTGNWGQMPEIYYDNLGYVGVHIFFMITGFLFISKILSDNGNTNWYRLYKSRIFRIYPLYIAALFVISLIVFYKSDFQLNAEPFKLLKEYVRWFLYHGLTINDFSETKKINAGVDWTLKYEWVFYLSLPLLAMIIARGKVAIALLLFLVAASFFYPQHLISISTVYFILFAIGGITAFLCVNYRSYAGVLNSRYWSVIAVCGILVALFYPNTHSLIHIISISLFFIPVAFGNSMFGLFIDRASILLGEISYSIYLLHGVVLYILFSVFNSGYVTEVSMFNYIYIMPAVSLLVVLMSTTTFLVIEKPCINYGRKKR